MVPGSVVLAAALVSGCAMMQPAPNAGWPGYGAIGVSEPAGSVIESKVDGDFEGWEGETIIKLLNGQIWQQTEYYYHYHYAYMPDVLVYRSGSG
jgi:hypothetical protein